MEKIKHLRFGKVCVRLKKQWLGFTVRTALILKHDGSYHKVGEIIGDGDMREPFFRYIGAN